MIKKINTMAPYDDSSCMLCWLYTALNYYRTFLLNKNMPCDDIDVLSLLKTSIYYLIKKGRLYELKNLCLDFLTFIKIINSYNCNFKNNGNFIEEFELIIDQIEDYLLYGKSITFNKSSDKINEGLKKFFNNSKLIFNKNIYKNKLSRNFDFIEQKLIEHISENEPIILCFDNSYKFNNNHHRLMKSVDTATIKNLYKANLNCCSHMVLIVGIEVIDNKLKNVIVQDNFGRKFDNGNYKVSYEYLQAFCHYIVFQEEEAKW